MSALLRLSFREMRKNLFWTILMFFVCIVAMMTIINSITNATSSIYQQKMFENSIGYDMSRVIHLHYSDTKETSEFAETLNDFLDNISDIEGVDSVGRFDQAGEFFLELENDPQYRKINGAILRNADSKYIEVPGITQIIYADQAVLHLLKNMMNEYPACSSDAIPVLVSESFAEVMPVGKRITLERTSEVYEVVGYIDKNLKWFDENDVVRFPMNSADGFFVSPFPESSMTDIMSQLSCLHNTYLSIHEDGNLKRITEELSDTAESYGFHVTGTTLEEEYEIYKEETSIFVKKQIALAVFISIMAINSVIAVFTTNTLLKKRQYGILLANGYSRRDLLMIIALESMMIIVMSGLTTWFIKLKDLQNSDALGVSLFRDILLTAHMEFTLPSCVLVCFMLVLLSVILPAINISRFQPSELIGGESSYGIY